MMDDLRIAAVVCRCPVGRLSHNVERTRHWVNQAKNQDATLVCFPEMNLTGYSNRDEIKAHAISANSKTIDSLVKLADDLRIALLVGFAEQAENGAIYASHMVITPRGRTALYRKIHLAPPETDHFSPGAALPIFDWKGMRFGIQLCYDAHFPSFPRSWPTPKPMSFSFPMHPPVVRHPPNISPGCAICRPVHMITGSLWWPATKPEIIRTGWFFPAMPWPSRRPVKS